MNEINYFVEKVLKADRILPRPYGSPGIMLSFLLPISVMIGCWRTKNISELYAFYAVYSFNILLNVLCLLFHMYELNSIYVTKQKNFLCMAPISVALYAYFHFLNMDLRRSICYTIANSLIYFEGIPFLFKVFPKTFTFGEVNIAIQGISLFLYSVFVNLNYLMLKGIPKTESDISSVILLLSLSWVLVFCIVPFTCKHIRGVPAMYIWGSNVVAMIFISNYYILNCNIFYWMWLFITKPERIGLIILWLICSILAVIVVYHHVKKGQRTNTIIRKYFHVLAVAVFLSGVLYDPNLLYFSSGCVFGFFIVLEVFRILSLPPLHEFLKDGFSVYCDEKDTGSIALTPICLLVGSSLPLWLYPSKIYSKESYLTLLSGVLSVGIGDACASVGGKLFGKHKWKGSVKTIEGTMFCILSQAILLIILIFYGLLEVSRECFIKAIIAICVTSFVEAKTDQIDNIVLPLTMYTLMIM